MANVQISAVDIEKLWYADFSEWSDSKTTTAITGTIVRTLLNNKAKSFEIPNVHQDTWSIEETEASQEKYKNQLTGNVYRMGAKEMGEVNVQFTIGRYDYELKQAMLGGTVIRNAAGDAVGWARARGIVNLKHILIARTEDKQYIVLPQANVNTREANTDKAIGLAVTATAMEPDNDKIMAEYWFDESEIGTINRV